MALDGCGLLAKRLLYFINSLIGVLGVTILAIMVVLKITDHSVSMEYYHSNAFVVSLAVLISLGTAMGIMSFFGEYCIWFKTTCLLKAYSALLVIMAGVEILVGVLAYSQSDKIGAGLTDFYNRVYTGYNKDQPLATFMLLVIHHIFNCCGVLGTTILDMIQVVCPEVKGVWGAITMPSCPAAIPRTIEQRISLIMGLFFGIAAFMILGLVCTIVLIKQKRRNRREDAMTLY